MKNIYTFAFDLVLAGAHVFHKQCHVKSIYGAKKAVQF